MSCWYICPGPAYKLLRLRPNSIVRITEFLHNILQHQRYNNGFLDILNNFYQFAGIIIILKTGLQSITSSVHCTGSSVSMVMQIARMLVF